MSKRPSDSPPSHLSGGARHTVCALRIANPHYTLGDLSRASGVSRQRVSQLLVRAGLPTRGITRSSVHDAALAALDAQAVTGAPGVEDDA